MVLDLVMKDAGGCGGKYGGCDGTAVAVELAVTKRHGEALQHLSWV